MKRIAVVLVPLLLIACSSTPKTDSSQLSQPGNANSSSAKSNSVAADIAAAKNAEIESKRLAAEKLAADILALQKQSVYFDFDKFSVKPEYLKVVQQQAAFIKAHKNGIVTVDGNTDERGSDEYNLALGGKRAHAVLKNLELIGVPSAQINAVSLGEEKPRLSCHEEKCWKENRRADFAYKIN